MMSASSGRHCRKVGEARQRLLGFRRAAGDEGDLFDRDIGRVGPWSYRMDDAKEFKRRSERAGGGQAARRQDDISAILIYTTFPSESEAKSVGRALVEGGLAACVNIFPQMIAIFSWQGEVEEAGEAAMIVKTMRGARRRGSGRNQAAASLFGAGAPGFAGCRRRRGLSAMDRRPMQCVRQNVTVAARITRKNSPPGALKGCRSLESWA